MRRFPLNTGRPFGGDLSEEGEGPPLLRHLIRDAVEALGGKTTNVAVRDWILSNYPDTKPSSIPAEITTYTVNHPSRTHYYAGNKPRVAAGKYDFLYRPGRGELELYDPQVHGVWEIVQTSDGRLGVRRYIEDDPTDGMAVDPSTVLLPKPRGQSSHTVAKQTSAPKPHPSPAPEGLREAILSCSQLFEQHPRYGPAEGAIRKLIKAFPSLTDFGDVLLKVTVINQLSSTNIYDVANISQHISRIPGLSRMIEEGNPEAVDMIRRGHGITHKSGKELDVYSFATKFCAWHNLEAFPIYDSLVCDILTEFNRAYSFSPQFPRAALRDYGRFVEICSTFRRWVGLPDTSPRTVDAGLWLITNWKNNPERWSDDFGEKVRAAVSGIL